MKIFELGKRSDRLADEACGQYPQPNWLLHVENGPLIKKISRDTVRLVNFATF